MTASAASTKPLPAAEPPVEHGGRLAAARQRFPHAPLPFYDLSTGINPQPYPLPPLPAEAFTRLPEPEALASLQATAATAYGVVDPALVVAGPGTQALINLLPLLRRRGSVAVLGPTYAEHAVAWRLAGHAVAEVTDGAALAAADVAVVVNPNNPDGRLLPVRELLALAGRLAARDGLLVVDEAFVDLLAPAASVAPVLPRDGLLVLRSFGKTYGLAGLRLGFALAAVPLADRLRRALGPWAVSGPAIAAGCVALADLAWRQAATRRLTAEATRLDTLLRGAGMTLRGGTPLYRLAERRSAQALYETLGRAGILVRRFPERPTLLRFGLPGSPAGWQRLEEALRP